MERYEIGLVAYPSDIDSIAKGFSDFMKLSDEERKRMSDKSARLLEEVFSKEKTLEKINQIVWRR